MDANIIEGYVEKVYGYAVNHTYSREEADDLSQEILFTVMIDGEESNFKITTAEDLKRFEQIVKEKM